MKFPEDTASMKGRIASGKPEPDAWARACSSNDNALRG